MPLYVHHPELVTGDPPPANAFYDSGFCTEQGMELLAFLQTSVPVGTIQAFCDIVACYYDTHGVRSAALYRAIQDAWEEMRKSRE